MVLVSPRFKPMKHTMPTGRGEEVTGSPIFKRWGLPLLPEEKMLMKMIVVSEGFEGAGKASLPFFPCGSTWWAFRDVQVVGLHMALPSAF